MSDVTELLDIKKYPESVLRKKCRQVESVTKREKRLFQQMVYTMRYYKGIGLAAPQVGLSERLIVADTGDGSVFLANPEILDRKGQDKLSEGCLSVPGPQVNVVRDYEIIVTGMNEKGQSCELQAKGLMARVLQHEIDHLEGTLIIDYMNILGKMRYAFVNKEKKG
ncbi:MAG: peptide deformylase [Candidatus Theseobacter exili]|nr:peptide deformylase [Candidatus Theseobacter exili]